MNQITKYLNIELFLGITLFLFGGICLFSFFEFIQEISDLDDKKYGVTQGLEIFYKLNKLQYLKK